MKEQTNNLLFHTLYYNQNALSAWLGGSAATQREDEYSDTDIVVISTNAGAIFDAIEKALSAVFGIQCTWKVEDCSKYQQRFYVLENSSTTYYVDVVVYEQTEPEFFSEYFNIERHGSPVVLFDKTGILKAASKNPKRENPHVDVKNTKARFEVMYRTFLKEYLRGKFIDAYAFYTRLVSIYVYLERVTITPEKHDFNLRYLYLDFPHEKAASVEQMLKASDLETMNVKAYEMKQRIASL